jgi:iron complex transport system substrate-binding protein
VFRRTPRAIAATAAVALASLVLSACGSDAETDDETGAAADAAFPVTIQHVFGETVIEEKPERVATVAWANHEVPLALGIVPVGMSKATWGDDNDNGVLPWVEDKLTELGAETPVLFDETEGIDFEAVADTQPDVILAAYSGLTQEEYDTLSKIAPVVAYPEVAWGTSVQDMITLNSQALGLAEEGEELVGELDVKVKASLEAHPALEGKKILFSWIDPADMSQVGFYTSHDTRPGFIHELGLPLPAVVETASAETEEFYTTVSAEETEKFEDVDVIVSYGATDGSTLAAIQADPLLSKIPAISKGAVAILADNSPLAASANPSPLSIGWGIDDYFEVLAAAAEKS